MRRRLRHGLQKALRQGGVVRALEPRDYLRLLIPFALQRQLQHQPLGDE